MEKTDSNKHVTDSTLADLIAATQHAKWTGNLKHNLIQDFLDGVSIEDTFNLTETISNYEKHIVCVAFDDYLQSVGYKVVRAFDDDPETIYPFQYENLEIEFGKEKRVIDSGVMLLDGPLGRLALELDYHSPETYKLYMYSAKDKAAVAEKFVQDLKLYARAHNYLKNKKIMPDYSFIEVNQAYTWDSVILAPRVKARIRRNIETLLANVAIYEA
ncbi:MAG: hypothetical protein ACRD2L_06570, partial [Terriglobia bacterium]